MSVADVFAAVYVDIVTTTSKRVYHIHFPLHRTVTCTLFIVRQSHDCIRHVEVERTKR